MELNIDPTKFMISDWNSKTFENLNLKEIINILILKRI